MDFFEMLYLVFSTGISAAIPVYCFALWWFGFPAYVASAARMQQLACFGLRFLVPTACALPAFPVAVYLYNLEHTVMDRLRAWAVTTGFGILWTLANVGVLNVVYTIIMLFKEWTFGRSDSSSVETFCLECGAKVMLSLSILELYGSWLLCVKVFEMMVQDGRAQMRAFIRYNAINRGPGRPKVSRAQAEAHWAQLLGPDGKVKQD
jgi:hypothetical protein